ncbi:PhzF family isomerase [Dyella tabacisoli]|uniref:PhzF family isomerase n=1 Tax=Dyella tabacisoli TaxID=2282381 RepID=A0A369UGX6_9GAMM|nr:PhzF family isomerase [Dyella tabacisoli]RDD80004.1 PhzF family isomerase [Dyella tabacisoli]
METTYRVYQIDAFTRTRFTGNPAGVVPHADGLSDVQMQAIARELNNSETAFVFRPQANDHDVHVRFFTPTTEVPICGHATIAAHYVRAIEEQMDTRSVRQLTGAGILQVDIEPVEGSDFRIWMHQRLPAFGPSLSDVERNTLMAALRITEHDLGNGPIEIVSTGHSKVMIPLRDRSVLNDLRPDLAALASISRDIGCNGYHLFTLADPDPGILAHARMFAPAIGIAEDPVTGNANGPLGAYIVQHRLIPPAQFRSGLSCWIRQGEAIGRPGVVKVEVAVDPALFTPSAVRIGGDAVIAFRTEIRL